MNIQDSWEKALKNTEIIRSRVQDLMTFSETRVPYILLSESMVNLGDTVVRKGEIVVEKPSLILPPHAPQLKGFDFELENVKDENSIINFLLVRGITMPSLVYNNTNQSLDIYEDKLANAIKHYQDQLQYKEDILTGLVVGSEDCWQFSVVIFICSQVARNAQSDIRKLWDDIKKRHPFNRNGQSLE